MAVLALDWDCGSLQASETGAMLAGLDFVLPGGRRFSPFARAHWPAEEMAAAGFAPHLCHLGAEFACLPFGVGGPLEKVAPAWRGLGLERTNDPPHGPAANAEWSGRAVGADTLCFTLDYPAGHAVRRLTRTIRAVAGVPAVDLSLVVEARRRASLSAGLHPIISLDRPSGALTLRVAFRQGVTYPAAVPGGAMLSAIGETFSALAAVPARGGGTVDLSQLPKSRPAEDVVQLCDVAGPVEVDFADEAAALVIDWDRRLLPSCQLWISDRALTDAPWGGRYRGLGIEPIASAFDFATAVSEAANPVRASGTATALAIDPAQPVEIRYRLSARPL